MPICGDKFTRDSCYDTHRVPRVFTFASAISLVLCFFCTGELLFAATHGHGMYWDRGAGQWVADSPAEYQIGLWTAAAFGVVLAVAPLWWLKRFLAEQSRRNREWRGRCGSCGYDLRASTTVCSECGRPVSLRHAGDASTSMRDIGPGTKNALVVLVTAPIGAAVAAAVLYWVLWTALALAGHLDL